MAAITFKPPSGLAQDAVSIVVDATQYTFVPGVPQHLPQEHTSAAVTALQGKFSNLVSPTATVTNVGTTGATTYTYELVATNGNGDTLPGATQSTATGNAALNGTNYNTISWASFPVGATAVKVIRTVGGATQGIIATIAAPGLTYNDQGATATAYSPAGAAVSQAAVTVANTEI